MTSRPIRSGDVLLLTREASPQFTRPVSVRVIRVLADRHTYHDWLWIEGYELGPSGDAVARRELYLMPAGLRWLEATPARPDLPCHRRPATSGRVTV
ncbi:hypothetical protein M8C17_17230 [Micromonospora sp. RHAY321]|uniref:hypothetical protein n=1 Tax=Micromonospora sp. RHAY321 TaxID=2944807 RepID=UPI00207C25EA|nr:hypothetical protein [Micromonospora sp. RHAY321]MCO1596899.1 hypothetical protein [Micromonospora sp. RHAY321]